MRREKKKGIEVQRVKPLTPTRATDALIGDEEQTGKKKEEEEEKERNRERRKDRRSRGAIDVKEG